MELPEVFVFLDEDEDKAASDLAARVDDLGTTSPFVIVSRHGRRLAAGLPLDIPHETPPRGADQEWAAELGTKIARSGADVVVSIGGGRTLDLAKLAAARSGLTIVAVPTQLSHDGISSPVAVVPNRHGKGESIGALAPRVIFLSLPTIRGAPPPSVAAGIGDLLANPLALRDWALAAERGLDEVDQGAWDLSSESFRRIEGDLDIDPVTSARDPGFLARLADALILSGAAMVRSGSSRPASGAEHEIAHALDELHGGRALHGAHVAFGCVVSVALYEDDHRAFRQRLHRLGLPQHPRELGLSDGDVVDLLLHAPHTRPGRFTILEASNLDEGSARSLVKQIWTEGAE